MSNSVLASYVQREAQLKQLQEQIEKMQDDPRLQNALEFQKEAEQLLKKYELSVDEAVQIIKPELAEQEATKPAGTKFKRRLKIYTNPTTGEKIETRGGNNKKLKEWKAEYGDDTVNSWGVFAE